MSIACMQGSLRSGCVASRVSSGLPRMRDGAVAAYGLSSYRVLMIDQHEVVANACHELRHQTRGCVHGTAHEEGAILHILLPLRVCALRGRILAKGDSGSRCTGDGAAGKRQTSAWQEPTSNTPHRALATRPLPCKVLPSLCNTGTVHACRKVRATDPRARTNPRTRSSSVECPHVQTSSGSTPPHERLRST